MSADAPNARAQWLGLALITVAIAALAWKAYEARDRELPAQPDNRAAASLAGLLAVPEAASAPALQPFQESNATSPEDISLAEGEMQVCGLGRVKSDASGQPRDMGPLHLVAQQAREQLAPALERSADEQSRAAGLVLRASGFFDAVPERPGCEAEACAAPAASAASAAGIASSDAAAARDALARMASASASPQVYTWALLVCRQQPGGMCQLLSAAQLARMDSRNAMAWLQAASEAQARGDAAAASEALFQVSRSGNADLHRGGLTSTVLAALPPGMAPLARAWTARQVFGVETAFPEPHLAASQHCQGAAMGDANRRQLCTEIAEVLAFKGTVLSDLGLAASIGQQAGWPEARVQPLRDERDALLQLQPGAGGWSCAALERTLDHLSQVGRQGELGALRAALQRSPESVEVLARRQRQVPLAAAAASSPASSSPGAP